MTRGDTNQQGGLPEEIRRQFRSPGVRRFTGSLPEFKIESDLPPQFQDLLAQIDQTEDAVRRQG